MSGLGFFIFLAILCLGGILFDPSSIEPLGPVKDLPLMVGGLLLFPWLVSRGELREILCSWLGRGLLALMVVAGFSATGAINAPAAREELLRLACLVLVALAAMKEEWTGPRLRLVALLALLGAGVNSLLVLAEHLDLGWKLYTRENRLLGLFSHQNDLAQFLSIAVVMGFMGHVCKGAPLCAPTPDESTATHSSDVGAHSGAPSMSNSQKWIRISILALIPLSTCALVLTLSRGAWLGTLVGLGYLLWRHKAVKAKWRATAVPLACLLLGVSLGALLVMGDAAAASNMSPLKTKSDLKALAKDSGRREIYAHSWLAVLEAPWLGSGPGNFPVIYAKTDRTRTEYVRYAHCDPLQWLVETGIVGALAALGLAVALWRRVRDAEGMVRVVAATLVVTLVHSLVSYPFCKSIPAAWAFWAMGVLAGSRMKGAPLCAPTAEKNVVGDGNDAKVDDSSGVGAHSGAPLLRLLTSPRGKYVLALLLIGPWIPPVLAPWRSSRLQQEAFSPLRSPPTSPQDALARHRQVAAGLEAALELQPHDPALLWSLAVARLQGGDPLGAENPLGELQRLTPYSDRVHLLLAQLFAARGDQASRLKCLDQAFEIIPDSHALLDELWGMLSWPGISDCKMRRDRLIAAYKRQGWWREREPELLAELGQTASMADLIHAQVILSDRLLVTPESAEDLAKMGLTQYRLGEVAAAEVSYARALKALENSSLGGDRPDLASRVLLGLGNARVQLGQREEALEVFRRARHEHPREPRFLEQELRLLMGLGKWGDIGPAIDQAAEASGDERRVRQRSAGLLSDWREGGDIPLLEALEQHKILVERFGNGECLLARGRFYLEKMGDPAAARADLEAAIKAGLNDEDRRRAEELLQSAN